MRRGGKARTRATRTRWRHRQPLTCQPREPSGRRHRLPSAGGQSEAVWSPCWGGKSRTMVDPGFELRTPVRRTACQRPGAHGGPARRLGEPRSALRCTEWLLEALPGLRGGWGNGGDVGRPSPRPDTLNTCLPGKESRRPSLPDSSRSKGLTAPAVRTGVPLAALWCQSPRRWQEMSRRALSTCRLPWALSQALTHSHPFPPPLTSPQHPAAHTQLRLKPASGADSHALLAFLKC